MDQDVRYTTASTPEPSSPRTSLYERIGGWVLMGVLFLLPLFVLPYAPVSFVFSKVILLSIVAVVGIVLAVITVLQRGKVTFSSNLLSISLVVLLAVQALSAILSASRHQALIGQGFEQGTVNFLLIMVVIAFLSSFFLRSKQNLLYAYSSLAISAAVISLFEIVILFGGSRVIPFVSSATFNTIGSWNDFGIFFGLIAVLILVTFEFLSLGKMLKLFLYVLFGLSLFFVVIVNLGVLWYVLGIVSLLFFVYFISSSVAETKNNEGGAFVADTSSDTGDKQYKINRSHISVLALIILVCAFLSVLAHDLIGDASASMFNISVIEARPSWLATWEIFTTLPFKQMILGIGPNNFLYYWLLHKPAGINSTIFWNTEFVYGIGVIPTALITSGILGFLAWVFFLGSFLYSALISVFQSTQNRLSRYALLSTFLASLYLWIFQIFYVPGIVVSALTFVFTGMFIGVLVSEKFFPEYVFSFTSSPRRMGLYMLVSVAFLMLAVGWGYVEVKKFAAHIYLQKAADALGSGNLDQGEALIAQSNKYDTNDVQFRILANAELARLAQIANAEGISDTVRQTQFQNALVSAVRAGQTAVTIDGLNYQNWLTLGSVYESVVPFPVDQAYENALAAYTRALEQNPRNPTILLLLARLEATKKNYDKAQEYIVESLKEKNDYIEAVYLLSQVQVAKGDIKSAIASVEQATLLSPNDPTVFFQLGLLKYNNKDYAGAADAMTQAIALNKDYANAKYFLGLSNERLGKHNEAISLFEDLASTNPDSQEVSLILSNLKAGRSPFTDAQPPVTPTPEKRGTLPVKEKEPSSSEATP